MIYQAHGKWILLGEHAVLRGCPALVFPLPSFFLKLTVEPRTSGSEIYIQPSLDQALSLVVDSLLTRALQALGVSNLEMKNGHFKLSGHFPPGQGLGFSAALCSVIAQWACQAIKAPQYSVVQLSHQLEHTFHGDSSGVDVVGVLSKTPQYFESTTAYHSIPMGWQPCWHLKLSDRQTRTADCVSQVRHQYQHNATQAQMIDQRMRESVFKAYQSLQGSGTQADYLNLSEAMRSGQACFEAWGLVPPEVSHNISVLYESGAHAVKLTGAGGQGCLLSLWESSPPSCLDLLPV